ncbi:MAG: DUF488 domain-containing protein [Parvibaculaceae bacterium]
MIRRIRIKRIYDPRDSDDGRRILVDRVWPRGVDKSKAKLALWLKDVAPTSGLRKWFGHDPARWAEFRRRYREELDANPAVEDLVKAAAAEPVTLLYGARDTEHNQAVVLAEYLRERVGRA